MPRYVVGLEIARYATAYVDAKNEEEALKKAKEFQNLIEESTEYEEIKDVEIIDIDDSESKEAGR